MSGAERVLRHAKRYRSMRGALAQPTRMPPGIPSMSGTLASCRVCAQRDTDGFVSVCSPAGSRRFTCIGPSAEGRLCKMEESDSLVLRFQRMLSPQPDSRVSDPQTVAEASRVASVGLLSEIVATDAQGNSANLVPGTESHTDDGVTTFGKVAEHAASDTMQG